MNAAPEHRALHRAPALLALVAALAVALLVASCGDDPGSAETNPPPAEPTESPELSEKPAGRVVDIGNEPEGLAVDGETGIAAVALRDPNRIALVDVSSGSTLKEVKVPESSRHLEVAAPGGPVLAPVEYTDELVKIDLPSGETSSVNTGDFPHDAVQVPGGRIFVGDEGGDKVTVIEGSDPEIQLPAPEQPGGIAYSDGVVAVVAVAAREIGFYDAETLEPLGELEAGAGPSHVVAGEDGRFYVTDTGGDAILVYEAKPEPRLLDRTNLPDSPYGIAIDNSRDRLWVTQTGRNRVGELELTDLAPKPVGDFPTVRQPNTVGVDERTGEVVVAGRADGKLQILDPETEGTANQEGERQG